MPPWLRVVLLIATVTLFWIAVRRPATQTPSQPKAPPVAESKPAEQQPVEHKPVKVQIVDGRGQPIDTLDVEPKKSPRFSPPAPQTETSTKAPPANPPAPKPKIPRPHSPPPEPAERVVIRDLKLKDQSGRVIYIGDIDLQPTLDRIAAGKRLRFPNDGSVFQNREKRLPKQASGYYREYVVPTPGDDGPGPQRLVIGEKDEIFYTSDHYRTFRRIK